MIDNFKKRPVQGSQKRTIDGFVNVHPHRRQIGQFAGRNSRQPVFSDRLKSGGARRNLDDFNRPEGYYHRHDATTPITTDMPRRQPGAEPDRKLPYQRERRPHTERRRSFLPWRRNKVKKVRPRWRQWALRGSFAVCILVIAFGAFFGLKVLKVNGVFKGGGSAAALNSEVDPSLLKGEGDGRVNILMLGRGGAGHDGADLTDTILVASIDTVNKKAALLSIPRDLWVKSGNGSSKINAVFANTKSAALRKGQSKDNAEKAGVAATQTTVERILGINMHYYMLVDFEGFRDAVDTVGGVMINVPTEVRDPTMAWENNWNPVLAKAGIQKMDGKEALMYVRSRHGSARGDFDRSERQRLFITALKSQIMSAGTYSNPIKVAQLMDNFGDHAETDFSINDLMRLYSLTKGIPEHDIKSIGLVDPPHDLLTTGNVGGQSVVAPKAGTYVYEPLQVYIRSQLPDGYIIKEHTPVTVLNGTTVAGKAGLVADELKSYSYNVIAVDNAPTQDYAQTMLVDLTHGRAKYTKNYLEKRLHVKATTTLPAGMTAPVKGGFVIIVGSNETAN